MLVAGDPAQVWVDANVFGEGPAWRADLGGHVLTPLDVARTATGHAVVLPHCAGRLADVLTRRDGLHPGESVTVAVSILRGAAEADRLGAEDGTWWLTEDLRPVLALTKGMPWRTAAAELLADVASGQLGELAAAVAAAAETIASKRRLEHRVAPLEDRLFAAATPEPLANPLSLRAAPPRGRHRVAAARGRAPERGQAEEGEGAAEREKSNRPLRALVASHLGGELTDRVAAALRRLGRRGHPSSPPRRRRAPLVLAALIAVAVLAVGLSWPADEPPEAERTATASPASTPTPHTETPPRVETPRADDAASAAPDAVAIVERLAECIASSDTACRAEVLEDPERPLPEGVATAGDAGDVTVLDDYGGVVALRVTAPQDPDAAQIVLIVRVGEHWLVRDVYDLADQP